MTHDSTLNKNLVLGAKRVIIPTFGDIENTVFNDYYDNHRALVSKAISTAMRDLVPLTGTVSGNNRLTFDQLDVIQKWLREKFIYVGDEESFDKEDYWDPSAWARAIMCDQFHGDCDDFGYAVLGIMYYVYGYSKKDIARVACRAETGEGHFVTWVKDDTGYTWQLENRIMEPKSIETMVQMGYNFLYYSTMETKNITEDRWYDANQKVKQILYDNMALLARQPEMYKEVDPIDAVNYINKSKTLQTSAGTIGLGAVGVASGLANQSDWKVVGMFAFIIVLGIIFWYLRTVTYKSLKDKE